MQLILLKFDVLHVFHVFKVFFHVFHDFSRFSRFFTIFHVFHVFHTCFKFILTISSTVVNRPVQTGGYPDQNIYIQHAVPTEVSGRTTKLSKPPPAINQTETLRVNTNATAQDVRRGQMFRQASGESYRSWEIFSRKGDSFFIFFDFLSRTVWTQMRIPKTSTIEMIFLRVSKIIWKFTETVRPKKKRNKKKRAYRQKRVSGGAKPPKFAKITKSAQNFTNFANFSRFLGGRISWFLEFHDFSLKSRRIVLIVFAFTPNLSSRLKLKLFVSSKASDFWIVDEFSVFFLWNVEEVKTLMNCRSISTNFVTEIV